METFEVENACRRVMGEMTDIYMQNQKKQTS